jgi:hypothetical protein
MWVFTETGFVSAVRKHGEVDLTVRARDRRSLEPLAERSNGKVEHSPLADYPYRISVSKADFSAWLVEAVERLTYTNFKSQVAVTRGYEYAHALGGVWSTMHDVEDENARQR